MLSVYLAGPSAELERVEAAADMLDEKVDLTWCWWLRIRAVREGRATDAGLARPVLRRAWAENVHGIIEAQAVVALARETGGLSEGTREEIAFALGRGLFVVVVGDPGLSLAATGCSIVHTIEQALELLEDNQSIRHRETLPPSG